MTMQQNGSFNQSKFTTASFSPQKYKMERTFQHSTADKLQEFENTHRLMETVIEQNRLLKSKLSELGVSDWKAVQGTTVLNITGNYSIQEWQMRQRNQYLQKKIQKLKRQQQRQSNHLDNIRKSDKWKKREKCGPQKCSYHKYLRLLRVKCPSTYY